MIKNLFISDIHLGSQHSHVKELVEFLSSIRADSPENIYIVGDFIDGWKLRKNWHWDNDCNALIRKIFGFAKRGTNIYLIAGNHDDFLREFIRDYHILSFGNIHLGDSFIHNAINGKKYLVIHGDLFDIVAKYAKWLCQFGDWGYEVLLNINYYIKKVFHSKWSLSQAVKYNVKKAVSYIGDFEICLADYAKTKNCQGVICGHIHHAADKYIGDVHYLNCGDVIESLTAVAEMEDGSWKLLCLNNG